ncbi:unnamed protein product [Kuraishia capsulata CBS 1993]|uniref:Major facilitator superfamily (MFS) profile domain-containing protein n=1 Tax=Kuraishia capsulata CBS 1993 TaxID=1382522 RepID=W6MIV6_9ASCO|nr:uncharacterized protein KUCA_T00002072001 [Kuraishia capsulata CBS 1993]CDK26101.1 unnamed protein product [Kuraishia capsulata CBS 1993]
MGKRATAEENAARAEENSRRKDTLPRKLLRFFWTDIYDDKDEQKLIFKVDTFIMSYCCVSYFMNYLDRTAFSNAYATGMKEELGLVGNQYTVINTCLTVGYIIAQIPHALLLQIIPPRYYFPANQVLWGICTMCTAACKTYPQVCAARFFLGIFESSTFSGSMYVLGSWLKENELGKRTGVFAASGVAGSMVSGYIQTAIYKRFNGTGSLASWKIMFLIDGAVVFPVAIYGLFFFPSTPKTSNNFYFTERELEIARTRLPPPKPKTKFDWTLIKRALIDWKLWVLSFLWVWGGALEAICNQSTFLLGMKAQGTYTVSQINEWPTGVQAVGILSILVAALWNDAWPKRKAEFIYILCACQLVSASILLKWDVALGGRLFAFFLAGTSYGGQTIYFSWANDICQGDDPLRAVVLFCMNMSSSILFCFWGILLYPSSDAPRFHNGFITSIVVSIVCALWAAMTYICAKYEKRKVERLTAAAELEEDSSDAPEFVSTEDISKDKEKAFVA